MLACAEHLLGAKLTSRFGNRGSDMGSVGGTSGNNLIKGSLVHERLGQPSIEKGAAAERDVTDVPPDFERRVTNMTSSESHSSALVMDQQYFRDMVVEYRIGERRELGHVCRGIKESLIEAKAIDRIDIENSAIGIIIPWDHEGARETVVENVSGMS